MDPLRSGALEIDVEQPVPQLLRLRWRGKSDSRDPSKILRPFFRYVLNAATAAQSQIEMHFEELEHLNSSTISEVIQLINDARAREVSLNLVYAGDLKWQALSFEALQRAMRPFESGTGPTVRFVAAETR